jgi:hypothetical protein
MLVSIPELTQANLGELLEIEQKISSDGLCEKHTIEFWG